MEIGLGKYLTLLSSTRAPASIAPRRPNASLRPSSLIPPDAPIRRRGSRIGCNAIRRSVRYDEDEDEDEEYGHNEEIAMLEMYSQSVKREVLLVNADLDGQEVQVLIFKGFSSNLSNATSPDPSKSVLPARAVIKSIDRVKAPFDPSNVHYIQKGVTWQEFKITFLPN